MVQTALKTIPETAMPVSYTQAVKALTDCCNLDEATTFVDAAEALAVWARIYKQDEAGRQAKQLKLHAHRRMGQLARELSPGGPIAGGGRAPGPVAKLKEAGLSRHGADAANLLAKMKSSDFDTVVNQEIPPAPTSVARRLRDPSAISGLSDVEAQKLADTHNLSVEEIQIRWIEGLRGDDLVASGFVPKTNEWVTTPEAADILATTTYSLASLSVGDKCPILRKPWGKQATSFRGCGALWYRPDLELVKLIRKDLCWSLKGAFRVLRNAREKGWEIRPPAVPREPTET